MSLALPVTTGAPTLARSEVATVFPRHTVFTVLSIVVLDITTAVGPEGEVVAVAFSGLAGGDSSLGHVNSRSCESACASAGC